MFLLRMETELKQLSSFYDFVPYKYGPYSFALYRDLTVWSRMAMFLKAMITSR